MNPKVKRYKYDNIVQYMEEISEQQSNEKYKDCDSTSNQKIL
ncbi:hypothetical protein [Flavobacterium lipolyticum]|nr:hypothetical protein [Flavobacterium sp. F-126]